MKLNTIIEGDSLNVLRELKENFIDIVITSPPYNAAHNYDNYNDNKEFDLYLENMKDIFSETYRVLKSGGRICVNVPFAIKNKESKHVIFLAHNIANILDEIGFINFELITWHKGKNLNHFQGNNTAWGSWKSPSCPSFRPLGESVLVFYKEIRQHKGDKKKIDITSDEFKEWTKNIWYFNESTDNNFENVICIPNDSKKKDHPAPYPLGLVERLLKLYSYKDDVVLDPFNGIGTTTETASTLNRKYIGIDLSKKYCDIAYSRIKGDKPARYVYNYDTSKLVNSSSNENTLNIIFPYKESFSPHLVPYLVDRYKIKKYENVLDPFLGTGSVFINDLAVNCYGFDTSKLAIEISLSKLTKLKANEYPNTNKIIDGFNESMIKKYAYPKWEPYHKYAEKEKYDIIMSFIDAFNNCSFEMHRYIKYTVISNLDKVFDYKRDGNGIKYRQSKIPTNEVITYLKELTKTSLKIKKHFDKNNNKTLNFKNESVIYAQMKDKFDLVVTSPPYANMFDYFEVYKMELWTSGIIKDYQHWKEMKKTALRSNKNANLNKSEMINNNLLEKAINTLKEKNIDSSTITMINNYFYDMKLVIENVYKSLRNNGHFFIVVGNSFYGSTPIVTDEIIALEAEKAGFICEEIIISRKLSTSSQQMKTIKEDDRIYLRESIVVLKKVGNNENKN